MQNIYRTFIQTYQYILDFIIPRYCAGCGKERDALCKACRDNSYQKWANCLVCGARNMTGSFCAGSCRKQTPTALKKVYWAGKYDNILKTAISQLKYKKRTELAHPLGSLLTKKFIEYSKKIDPNNYVVVPIPLHHTKQSERGFNQAELIARSFAKETSIEMRLDILKKIINTKAQAKTPNRQERMQNLENAFMVDINSKSDLNSNYGSRTSTTSRTIILIDDVSTTGATLFHASRALSAAGVIKIIGLVVAHG